MSCQETDPGIAWIDFDSMDDLQRFLNLVTRYEPGADTLYNRITYQLSGDVSSDYWIYQVNWMDLNEEEEEEQEQEQEGRACGDEAFLVATIGVYFPVTDIPVLLDRMIDANS